jgi:ribonuclease-3
MLSLNNFQDNIAIRWNNPALLQEALTHSSYVNENPHALPNERMEFLGDALIGLVLGQQLYNCYPDMDEGELTYRRSLLVRGDTLANVARSINLGAVLYLGKGEEKSGGRNKTTNLAGSLEALAASLMLDQGLETARTFILRILKSETERLRREMDIDYKSQFQLLAQAHYKSTPVYRITDAIGLAHDKQYTAELLVDETVMAIGYGRSKKLAESDAARSALEKKPSIFTD